MFKLTTYTNEEVNYSFPALYKCIQDGANNEIVMFLSENIGFAVVAPSHSSWEVGELDDGCISCFRKDTWQRLPKGTEFIFTQE